MANKANVKKWVKALRSGKFKQCYERLFDGKRYCCLGVACVLAGMKPNKYNSFGNSASSFLPLEARKWLGIKRSDPRIGERGAVTLNDGLGFTFKQIADEIEEHGVE